MAPIHSCIDRLVYTGISRVGGAMILHDQAISDAMMSGHINISPNPRKIQPGSVDLHLGEKLIIKTVDGPVNHSLILDGPRTLYKGMFILGATQEWLRIGGALCGKLEGKSTRAREGLIIENAGYVDPGWYGNLTLELANLCIHPITLEYGMPICQIRFEQMTGEPVNPYGSEFAGSHYQGSTGPVLAYTEQE